MPDPDFTALVNRQLLYPEFELDDSDFESAFEVHEDSLPGLPGISGG